MSAAIAKARPAFAPLMAMSPLIALSLLALI